MRREDYEALVPTYTQWAEQIVEKLQDIPHFSITYRIKDYASIVEKTKRKAYQDVAKQMQDIIGIRITCLFLSDVQKARRAVLDRFTVVEDSLKGKQDFSYQAVHCVIKQDFFAEVQIHTLLQMSWAEIEHELNYKKIGLDAKGQRTISALSAMLELADNQFESLKEYTQSPTTLSAQSLHILSKEMFPWGNEQNIEDYEQLYSRCVELRLRTLDEVRDRVELHLPKVLVQDKEFVDQVLNNPSGWPQLYEKVKETRHFFSPVTMLQEALR